MRKTVAQVFLLLAVLCLAFAFFSPIVMMVQDWPCMSRPSSPFSDAVTLALFASIPLGALGVFLKPRPVSLVPV